jgi:hypothetical protein
MLQNERMAELPSPHNLMRLPNGPSEQSEGLLQFVRPPARNHISNHPNRPLIRSALKDREPGTLRV